METTCVFKPSTKPIELPQILHATAELVARVKRGRKWEHLGVIGRKSVTTAFVDAIVNALQGTGDFGLYKYHDSGTGVVAENITDTTLGTPCGEARDIGTQEDGASANIYKSVATNTYGGSFAITEHGLFNAAAAGELMDRTKFDAINVVSGNQIEFTYQITFTAGG